MFQGYGAHRALHSFPTRRSSDLARLIQHQAIVDVAGLKETETIEPVKVHVAAPQKWEALNIKHSALFIDAQWRSPSRLTGRSEEHTSELQSQSNLVCRLLLEKKK